MVDLQPALDALDRGEIVGLPTDTVYGIAADPWNPAAVADLFAAKGRSEANPIPILAADIEQAASMAVLDEAALGLATRHWPGALTLVLPRTPELPEWIGDPSGDSVGIRVPDHPVALDLLAASGPLAVTSANRTGCEPAVDAVVANLLLGEAVSVYVPGRGRGGAASTVVDLVGEAPRVLRQGAVIVEGP